MQVAYPYRLSGSGRTALQLSYDDHIREMIEQVLFTSPGERVNRPDFGVGVTRFVFAAANDETLVTTRFLVQGALQKWLGDLIDVEAVEVASEESTLNVRVQYRVIQTQQRVIAKFTS